MSNMEKDRLKDFRKLFNLTQKEVSEWQDIPIRTLQSWEASDTVTRTEELVLEKMRSEIIMYKKEEIQEEAYKISKKLTLGQKHELHTMFNNPHEWLQKAIMFYVYTNTPMSGIWQAYVTNIGRKNGATENFRTIFEVALS